MIFDAAPFRDAATPGVWTYSFPSGVLRARCSPKGVETSIQLSLRRGLEGFIETLRFDVLELWKLSRCRLSGTHHRWQAVNAMRLGR